MVQSHLPDQNQPQAPQQPVVHPYVANYRPIQNPFVAQHQRALDDLARRRAMGQNYPSAPNQPNNAAPRRRQRHQMSANSHPARATNEVRPSANFQPMAHSAQQAQPVQPAQPAQPSQTSQSARQYLSSEEDIEHVREWLEEDGDDFGDHIQGFQNLARYKEAEKRTRQTETAALASDFPEDGAQQNQMARRLYRAFKTWRLGIPGCSFTNQAINKVAKQKKFMLELAAWQLLVRYSKPQNLVKADTN